jgi:hypothetical protein
MYSLIFFYWLVIENLMHPICVSSLIHHISTIYGLIELNVDTMSRLQHDVHPAVYNNFFFNPRSFSFFQFSYDFVFLFLVISSYGIVVLCVVFCFI